MTAGRLFWYIGAMNILISGAGVAGLTLAYWLKRYGFNPTLVEKHPVLRTGGYKIDLRGAALDILRQMEIYDQVVENRTAIRQAICIDSEGNQVVEMTADFSGARITGVDLEIMRCRLCTILKKAVGGVECLFGDSITSLIEKDNGVEVTFEKSAPRTFDLVIGADGLHSGVRKTAFGEESQFSKEFGVFVSVFPIPNFLNLEACEIEHFPYRKFLNIYKDKNDPHATVSLAFSIDQPFCSRDVKEQKQLIKDTFANSGWEMPNILKAMEETPDFYFDSTAQIHMPSWSKGRVALIGDAAYSPTPMSGQGTSMAVIGAYVLAGELKEAKGNYKEAFASYETLLRPFIRKNQDLANMSASIMQGAFFYRFLLQYLLPLLPQTFVRYFKGQGLKRIQEAANAIQLKEYS